MLKFSCCVGGGGKVHHAIDTESVLCAFLNTVILQSTGTSLLNLCGSPVSLDKAEIRYSIISLRFFSLVISPCYCRQPAVKKPASAGSNKKVVKGKGKAAGKGGKADQPAEPILAVSLVLKLMRSAPSWL